MNMNSQKDNFIFLFPKDFVPELLENRYKIHLKNFRKPYSTILDYMNSLIKDIDVSGLNQTLQSQKTFYGKETKYRSSVSPYDLYDRKFTVSMRNVDFNIVYFMLQDIYLYHYMKNHKLYLEDFVITILDNNRREQVKIFIREILFSGLSPIKFSNNEKEVDEQVITLTFDCNKMDIEYIPVFDDGEYDNGEVYDKYSEQILKNNPLPPKEAEEDDSFIIGH